MGLAMPKPLCGCKRLTPDANDMVPVMLGIEAAEVGDEAEAHKWLKFNMGGFLEPPFSHSSAIAQER
jgi:hypothetical protein